MRRGRVRKEAIYIGSHGWMKHRNLDSLIKLGLFPIPMLLKGKSYHWVILKYLTQLTVFKIPFKLFIFIIFL